MSVPERGFYGDRGYVYPPGELITRFNKGLEKVADAAIRVAQAEDRNFAVRKFATMRMKSATRQLDTISAVAEDACLTWNKEAMYTDHPVREELAALGIRFTSFNPINREEQ